MQPTANLSYICTSDVSQQTHTCSHSSYCKTKDESLEQERHDKTVRKTKWNVEVKSSCMHRHVSLSRRSDLERSSTLALAFKSIESEGSKENYSMRTWLPLRHVEAQGPSPRPNLGKGFEKE
jgi:hypothetical protein